MKASQALLVRNLRMVVVGLKMNGLYNCADTVDEAIRFIKESP